MNSLENQFRKWTLRRPSARLKARLFPTMVPASSTVVLIRPQWGWLVPAAGALLLTMLMFSSGLERASSSTPDLLASVGVSNAGALGPYVSQHDGDRNVLTTILEWTNADHSHSSIGSLLLNRTNNLRN